MNATDVNSAMNSKLQLSGILTMVGLAMETFSLFWNKPLSFLIFLSVGGLFILVGIVIYLYSVVSLR